MWALFAFSCFNVESFVSSPSRSLCFDWRCLRYRRRRRVDVEASQFESDSASSRSDRRSRKDRDPKTETRIPRSTLRPKFLEFLLELSSWNKNRDFIKQLAKSQEFFFFGSRCYCLSRQFQQYRLLYFVDTNSRPYFKGF